MKNESTPKAVQDCHELLLWMIPHVDKFPRVRRFTLGDRLENTLMAVLQALVEASYSRNKGAALNRANLELDVARHFWRLAFELKAIALKTYEHGADLMVDLGRQIGGWRKTQAEART